MENRVNDLLVAYQSLTEKEKRDFDMRAEELRPVAAWQKEEVEKRIKAIEQEPGRLISKEETFKILGWK